MSSLVYMTRLRVWNGVEWGGCTIRWVLIDGLEGNLTPAITAKFRERINTTLYIRYVYSYIIENIEDGRSMVFHKRKRDSPWLNTFAEVETWLNEQENDRLNHENIERPNTKLVFVRFSTVYVRVELDRQPLLGTGPLPDWLRNHAHERAMVALDT